MIFVTAFAKPSLELSVLINRQESRLLNTIRANHHAFPAPKGVNGVIISNALNAAERVSKLLKLIPEVSQRNKRRMLGARLKMRDSVQLSAWNTLD